MAFPEFVGIDSENVILSDYVTVPAGSWVWMQGLVSLSIPGTPVPTFYRRWGHIDLVRGEPADGEALKSFNDKEWYGRNSGWETLVYSPDTKTFRIRLWPDKALIGHTIAFILNSNPVTLT